MDKLNVNGTEIQVYQIEENDYISLTDMVRNIDNGSGLIEKWLRNKNTIEFLGIWEEMYNNTFNHSEYQIIMQEAGLNRFMMSVKQWVSIKVLLQRQDAMVVHMLIRILLLNLQAGFLRNSSYT